MHVCTWIMEEVPDHSKTYHCSKGSGVPLVFCSLCPTPLRVGTLVSVAEHVNTHIINSEFFFLTYVAISLIHFT